MATKYTRDEGVNKLMQVVIHRARNQTIEGLLSDLTDSPQGPNPSDNRIRWGTWYRNLDDQHREIVTDVITNAVDEALFSVFAILDRAAGGNAIKGVLSDFALYLQTYQDVEQEMGDVPDTRVKLNPVDTLTDLHDIYRWQVEDLSVDEND